MVRVVQSRRGLCLRAASVLPFTDPGSQDGPQTHSTSDSHTLGLLSASPALRMELDLFLARQASSVTNSSTGKRETEISKPLVVHPTASRTC